METYSSMLMLLCAGVCFTRNSYGARILGVFPNNVKSHFSMHQEIMKSLADAGHQVDVVSNFPQKQPYPNYTDIIDLSETIPIVVNGMTYQMIQYINKVPLRDAINAYGTRFCELLELPEMQNLIKNPPRDPPYDLFITEFFLSSCYLAFGRHLNVPVVALTSMPPILHANEPLGNPCNTAIISELRERSIYPMNFWQRLKNTIYISALLPRFKYYISFQTDMVRKHFGPDMPDVGELEREVALNLVNSHVIFQIARPITPAIVEVPGVHVHDDGTPLPIDVEKWLNECKGGFIYFSFGSMARVETFPNSTITEIYGALTRIAPLCVLMKVAIPEELPSGLPENVRTLSWVPQVRILKHENIRGFITHGGLMGLQEAVTFAVPLIGIPLFGDQPGNIQICVERGFALSLDYENLTADNIVRAIHAIINDPTYKNKVNAISEQFLDRQRSPRDTSVFWIEYILRHGEDALRSPAVKLRWWELALLDVYGTMIAIVLLVLYIIKVGLSFLYRRIFTRSSITLSASKKRR